MSANPTFRKILSRCGAGGGGADGWIRRQRVKHGWFSSPTRCTCPASLVTRRFHVAALCMLCRACSAASSQGGKIVISHPKGASNVDMQRRANPMLVPNRLPTEAVSARDFLSGIYLRARWCRLHFFSLSFVFLARRR